MQPINTKQEFFTLDSRLTIQRGNVYQKSVKQETETGFYRYIVFVVYLLFVFLTVEEMVAEKEYYHVIQVVVISILLAPLFKRIYEGLFVKTWKSNIPLKDIKSISTRPLNNGLETELTLHLSSGRKKYYTFRNAEGQLQLFVDAVSAHLTLPAQPAV